MAFKLDNLTTMANTTKTGVVPAIWSFWNEAGDTVTTAGYIPAGHRISAGDQILVIDSDKENNTWYHATIAAGVITLVANS